MATNFFGERPVTPSLNGQTLYKKSIAETLAFFWQFLMSIKVAVFNFNKVGPVSFEMKIWKKIGSFERNFPTLFMNYWCQYIIALSSNPGTLHDCKFALLRAQGAGFLNKKFGISCAMALWCETDAKALGKITDIFIFLILASSTAPQSEVIQCFINNWSTDLKGTMLSCLVNHPKREFWHTWHKQHTQHAAHTTHTHTHTRCVFSGYFIYGMRYRDVTMM